MNFYDNINNLVAAFKQTEEYKNYNALKEELKKDEKAYQTIKEFKDKQSEVQMAYINGQGISKETESEMQNLYSIVIQNDTSRKLLEIEIRINRMLADIQKALGDAVEGIVRF